MGTLISEKQREAPTDLLASAAEDLLRGILRDMGKSTIVSIGLPSILRPHTELVRDWPLLVMEKNPGDSYNFGNLENLEVLPEWTAQYLKAHGLPQIPFSITLGYQCLSLSTLGNWGFTTPASLGHVVPLDVSEMQKGLNDLKLSGLEESQWLLLLDTCSISVDLGPTFRKRFAQRIPEGSVLMLNTCENRHPGTAQRHARILMRDPELLGSFDYLPRYGGGLGGKRSIHFFQETGN